MQKMKKCAIYILFMLFLTLNPCRCEVITNYNHPILYKIIKFKAGEKDANKILFDFVKGETQNPVMISCITLDNVLAYKVDLDDDGINEIVGVALGTAYAAGSTGFSLFILKRYKNNYKNLSLTAFWPWNDLKILKRKVNGFHVIELKKTNGELRYLEYDNKFYQ